MGFADHTGARSGHFTFRHWGTTPGKRQGWMKKNCNIRQPMAGPTTLTQPLRILVRTIEVVAGFVALELSFARGGSGLCQQRCHIVGSHRFKAAGRLQRLLQNLERVATGDDHAGRQVHGVVQTFDRRGRLAVEDQFVPQRFHAEHSNPVLDQNRENLFLKAVEVRVHDVQGHLHSIEGELMREPGLEHLEMKCGALMTGKADVLYLSLFLSFENRFHASAAGEDPVRIGVPNDLMKLQQINVIGLQAAQRFIELLGSSFPGLPVDLGHEERLLPIAVAQRLAHADLALAAVVIPAVVEEVDAAVETGADNADAFLLVGLHAEVISTQTYDRDLRAGAAQFAHGNSLGSVGEVLAEGSDHCGSADCVEEAPAVHGNLQWYSDSLSKDQVAGSLQAPSWPDS